VKNSSEYEGAAVVHDGRGNSAAQEKARAKALPFSAILAMNIMPRRLIDHALR
jgi:hypothetical protein